MNDTKSTQLVYPIQEQVEYQDDDTYRDTLMRVVLMVNGSWPEDADDNTVSEVFEQFLSRIYDATKDNEILYKFYIDAAAFMISEDPGIGLAVLFSFDYFTLFHLVLCDYFIANDTKPFTLETPSVVNLRVKMTR